MSEITVEEVLEAYRETGLSPCRRTMKGCALGAIARHRGVDAETPGVAHEFLKSVYGLAFITDFAYGFDYNPDIDWDLEDRRPGVKQTRGFQQGQAAARAVFKESA